MIRHLPLALLLSLSTLACSTERLPVPDNPDASDQRLTRTKALIGDAPCDSQAQCRTVAVGFKSCGGPSGYLAWSTKNVDPTELAALVQRHAQFDKADAERSGMLSDCRVVTDPGAQCRLGRCVLAPIANGPG